MNEKGSNEKKLNIYQKMSLVTNKIQVVKKNLKVGKGTKSEYSATKEADILKAVKTIESEVGIYSYPFGRKILKDERIGFRNSYGETENFVIRIETTYRFLNLEDKNDYVDVISYGDGIDSQDKAPGKAMTYSDKYALMKAYKIETKDDENTELQQPVKKEPTISEEKNPESQKENLQLLADFKELANATDTNCEDIYKYFKIQNDMNFTKTKLKKAIEILKKKPRKNEEEVF